MKKCVFSTWFALAILFINSAVFSQNLSTNGRFPGKYFSIKDYGSAAQIWNGIQSKDGLYIFGNRQDILCFNGQEWNKIKVDKEKTSKTNQARSYGTFVSYFFQSSDGNIYVGRENNFGYLTHSSKGELVYKPLKTIDEKNAFGKVWNIFEINNGEILFVAEYGVYKYANGKVTPFVLPKAFNGMLCKTSCRVDRGMLLSYQTDADAANRTYRYLYIDILTGQAKEIAEQNHQLERQKEEITLKTMDILDSIHYAKRIQNTILPTESRLHEMFDEYFVFYRPKDIVSGDFYWAREVQGQYIFASVDCTGDGVPGALVSIVGNNGLLRAVNEFRLTAPNDILDKLREIVISSFRADENMDVKDGMDIALCSIDKSASKLYYSGANNECVIIRNGEIIELKPDKQPIGQFVHAQPFTLQSFDLIPGDCIYLYTDGYVDQFGGDKMKKFKSKPFRNMLSEIADKSMKDQYQIIQSTFDSGKSELDQVDDVCVFGVKFTGKL